MTQFKAGMRVRITNNGFPSGEGKKDLAVGDVVTLKAADIVGRYDSDPAWCIIERSRYVWRESQIEPAFMPGDTVVWDGRNTKMIGTVVGYVPELLAYLVEFPGWGGGHDGNTYRDRFEVLVGNNNHYYVTANGLSVAAASDAVAAKASQQAPMEAMVPHIVAKLIDGVPRPASVPHVHKNGRLAMEEAERLAMNCPGVTFAVLPIGATVTGKVSLERG